MTRYRHGTMQNVWESFEWLLQAKLEEVDHMTRQIYKDMQFAGAKKDDIEQFLPTAFAQLWDKVAVQENAKSHFPKRRLS